MSFIIGLVIVFVGVFGSFAAIGGNLAAIWQPGEFGIIGGALIGAFIIANGLGMLGRAVGGFMETLRGPKHDKTHYLELLGLLYQTFKLAKAKGMLALEGHVESPDSSPLFGQFPTFANDKHARTFMCDYLRLLTLGTDNPHEVEALLDEEIDAHHHERLEVSNAIQIMGDAAPAIGIVAAVMGVIKTMASINEPPEVLGALVAGALVGTFLGIFLGYAVIGPIATSLKTIIDAESRYYMCIKAGVLAYMQGYAPAVCVEFARKSLQPHLRPDFYEVEEYTQSLRPV